MALKGASCINILTYVVFTVVPILAFSTIMVLRLMENHSSEVDHLSNKILDLQEMLEKCGNETTIERDRVSLLLDSQRKCRNTLVKVSRTLDGLTRAFQVQYQRSNVAESKLEKNLAHFSDLQKSLVLKDGMTIKLQDNNDQLRQKVDKLSVNLTNVTLDKELLKNKLQSIEEKADSTLKPTEMVVPLIQ